MKTICIVLVSLTILCPLLTEAKPTIAEPTATLQSYKKVLKRSLELQSCAESFRDDLRPIAEDFGGWVGDVLNRMVRIIDLRRTCNDMEMSDPPTRWEIIQREACELRFQGSVAFEIARLNYEIAQMLQSYPPMLRESIQRYLDCASGEVPDFYEFRQMMASLHRN